MKRAGLALGLALFACLSLSAPAALANTPLAYTGQASGCKFEITFAPEDRTFAGKVTDECKLEGGVFRGGYEGGDATLATTEGKVSPFDHDVNMEDSPGWAFSVPVAGTTLEALLTEIGEGKKAHSAGQGAVVSLMEGMVTELYAVLTEKLELQGGKWMVEMVEKQEKVEDKAREYCGEAEELDPFCEDTTPKTSKLKPGSESEVEAEQAALCPVNMVQKSVIFVCLPSFVQGDFSAGKKPLVILPGGMLIALPIGGTNLFDLSTTPTISSQQAIASLGGVIVGYNLKLKAADLALSAGVVDMAGTLTLEGENLNLGAVNLQDTLGALPQELLNNKHYKEYQKVAEVINMPDPISESGSLSTPIWLGAARIEVKPSEAFQLGTDSTLSASGRGGPGGSPADAPGGLPEGEAPGPEGEAGNGAKADFGGSHGGYGAYPETPADWQAWGLWQEIEGRGATFDSPFSPSQPGAGGSGNASDNVDWGGNGGGVVRINAPKASVRVLGKVDVSGEGAGYSPDGNPYTPDSAGAGGSVYLTAKSLGGSGEIDADGGGYEPEAFNSWGGSGGGGRIALVYGGGAEWTGSAHAHGGVDEQFTGLDDEEGWPWYFRGTGGAGTVFSQEAVFDDLGTVKEGKGEFPEGTLTIDGGLPPGHYPPPDGTPIADSWGGSNRRLVLTGEAHGYGNHPDFGAIEVLGGAELSGEIGSRRLAVSAGRLEVDASSRIEMNGRGYAGGPNGGFYDEPGDVDAGETAPGQRPATRNFGGSHGGAGGTRATSDGFLRPEQGDVPGATYDDPLEPSLPGGGGGGEWDTGVGNPGGGVLDVTAGTLVLDGQLAADGEDGNGPTLADPTPFGHQGAAGAGGSILVRSNSLSGSGTIHADGGWACLTEEGPTLLPHGNPCSSGAGGGGGGGRVAVYATQCGWSGALRAAGGINQAVSEEAAADPGNETEVESARNATGEDGSTYLADGGGACLGGAGEGGGGGGSGSGGSGSAGGGGSGASPLASPRVDRTRPVLSRLKAGGAGLSLVVDEPGTLEVRLARCRARRVHRHRTTVCRVVRTLSVRVERPGAVRIPLPAHLRPGRYLATIVARDVAGNASRPVSRRFLHAGRKHHRHKARHG